MARPLMQIETVNRGMFPLAPMVKAGRTKVLTVFIGTADARVWVIQQFIGEKAFSWHQPWYGGSDGRAEQYSDR